MELVNRNKPSLCLGRESSKMQTCVTVGEAYIFGPERAEPARIDAHEMIVRRLGINLLRKSFVLYFIFFIL